MNKYLVLIVVFVFAVFYMEANEKSRVIVLADMGNEPDEEQQIVHFLMYANEFDIEGLIAVTGKFLNPNSENPLKKRLYPELFHKIIDGYGKVSQNLKIHANGWPEAELLHSLVATGQPGYGVSGIGYGKASSGSRLIANAILRNDSRPLYVIVNAGSNTLGQALWDLRDSLGHDAVVDLVKRLRVFENGAQDDCGAWICSLFPEISWIRSNYQTYCYGGPSIDGGFNNKGEVNELGPHVWKPYAYNGTGQHQWLLEHVIGGHGPLGACYPVRQFQNGGISFMEGGGTIPFLALVNKGLYDINRPWWGGWAGRYSRDKKADYWSKHQSVKVDEEPFAPFLVHTEEADSWRDPESGINYTNNLYAPVWRWRRAFVNDFQCRMDWCRQPFEGANHNPVAVINSDSTNQIIIQTVKPGSKIKFDASMSFDPDGDRLVYRWFYYPEAGTYAHNVKIIGKNKSKVQVGVPHNASGSEIHIILELHDQSNIANLYDYRRVVLLVE
jgi:hypothetical protein